MALLDLQVAADTDDCDAWGPGGFYLYDNIFWLSYDSGAYQDEGARFLSVSIPQGASILNAHVTVRAAMTEAPAEAGPGTCRIRGEDADGTVTFSTRADFNSRPRTASYIDWPMPSFVAGTDYDSPDLSTVIQEVISRPGWASGNALVLFFRDITGLNWHRAHAHDGSPANAPRLHIEYLIPGPVIDPVSETLIAVLKADGPLLAALAGSDAIKESEWRGTDFDYPAVRLDVTDRRPEGTGACAEDWLHVTGRLIAYSKEDSSAECLILLGLLQNAIQRRRLALPGLTSLELKIAETVYPFRELNLWRGEVVFATTAIET